MRLCVDRHGPWGRRRAGRTGERIPQRHLVGGAEPNRHLSEKTFTAVSKLGLLREGKKLNGEHFVAAAVRGLARILLRPARSFIGGNGESCGGEGHRAGCLAWLPRSLGGAQPAPSAQWTCAPHGRGPGDGAGRAFAAADEARCRGAPRRPRRSGEQRGGRGVLAAGFQRGPNAE